LGRLLDGKGKRTRGIQCKDANKNTKLNSIFNSVSVHKLVWLAFSDEPIGELYILHN